MVATSPYVMVLHPSLPVNTVPELIAYAKAHPGKINLAGSTSGSPQHLARELINRSAVVDMLFVPYKGTGALLPDLLAGRLQADIDNIAVMTPYVKSGQLRGIAVTSPKRTALFPDLPTVAEGGLAGFQTIGWFGAFAPVRTPPAIVAALSKAVEAATSAPKMRGKLTSLGAEPQSGKPEGMRDLLQRETATWAKVIKEAGIELE